MKLLVLSLFFQSLFLVSICDLKAADIEVGGGFTFSRYESLRNSGVVNLNLITRADSYFPTEWSLGYIFGQSKNTKYMNNDEPTAWFGIGKRIHWKNLIVGLGLVAVDQPNQRISAHVNFKSEAGIQLGPLVLLAEHISNAGIHGTNDGETFFSINYSFSIDKY